MYHPVQAGYTLTNLWITAGINNMRAFQARLSANDYADQVEQLFEQDYDLEQEYHSILNGKPICTAESTDNVDAVYWGIVGKWDQ